MGENVNHFFEKVLSSPVNANNYISKTPYISIVILQSVPSLIMLELILLHFFH